MLRFLDEHVQPDTEVARNHMHQTEARDSGVPAIRVSVLTNHWFKPHSASQMTNSGILYSDQDPQYRFVGESTAFMVGWFVRYSGVRTHLLTATREFMKMKYSWKNVNAILEAGVRLCRILH